MRGVRANAAGVLFVWLLAVVGCSAGAPNHDLQVIVVDSSADSGRGTLREAIELANASGHPLRIELRLDAGDAVKPITELPAVTAPGVTIVGNGAWLEGGNCNRSGGRAGCDGLVVTGAGVRVRELNARGFMFDGLSVTGPAAVGVVISDCHCRDNLDDGIGISGGARDVRVERCLLERNGFRSKGKGVLVFDGSSAFLRENTMKGNRDGVTVSRRSSVRLEDNVIEGNYDKGLGVSGAFLSGKGNSITANGVDNPALQALSERAGGAGRPPNRDGLRLGLDSRVDLKDTVITGNADAGVVVNDNSLLLLSGGRVTDNGSRGVVLHDTAVAELQGVEVSGHGHSDFVVAPRARLKRFE